MTIAFVLYVVRDVGALTRQGGENTTNNGIAAPRPRHQRVTSFGGELAFVGRQKT